MMNQPVKRIYEFESFRVDAAERRILLNGEPVVVTPKVFDILLVLLENRGRTVEKEELIRRIWVDTYVEEGSLNRNISTLRKALGDDSHEQRLIKTLPKQGYRFTARVEEFEEGTKPAESVWPARRWKWIFLMTIFAGLAAALAWTAYKSPPKSPDHSGLTAFERKQFEKFRSDNHDANHHYVTGRSLWHRRSAEELHLSIVHLERAVSADPGFALAHAALADAYAFDVNKYKDAERHAQEALRLNPDLAEPHATIGFIRLFWDWRNDDAKESFRIATTRSPDYATAHQWYAISLITGRQGGAALAEMKRAAELDPRSVSINADLCQFYYFLEKHDDALNQCRKTLELDPNSYTAGELLYEIMTETGRHDEAVDQFFRNEAVKSDFALPFPQREELKTAFRDGGIRSFWQALAEILNQRKSFYGSAKYLARLGQKEKALNALRLAAEGREFEFVFLETEPAFRELRSEPAFEVLKNLLRAGKSQ